jgi:hypothetical protein
MQNDRKILKGSEMKILAGIPTRLRTTSGIAADVLSTVCDEVLVVSQGAVCHSTAKNVVVHEKDVNFGMIPARNYILQYAIDNNFDLVFECDDDVKFPKSVMMIMIEILRSNPTLGAISSESRAYFNWNKDVECTRDFLLAPCPAQLWGMEVKKVKELGLLTVDYLEDREYGLRMWKNGYAVGQVHVSLDQTHNPFIARTMKQEKEGGQATGEKRYKALGEAISTVVSMYPDLVTLRQSEFGKGGRTFSTRYNWSKLLSYPINRFGYSLGYEDSKGRRL